MAGHLIKASGTSSDSSTYRARDVEFDLKGVDIDPRIKIVMCKIAEHQHHNTKGMAELAVMFDQMVDTMSKVVTVAGNMKDHVEKFQKGYTDEPMPEPEVKQ